jgi:predicted Rossmann fold nucleotide-binding protein DprA/Smf involved in DNA uptake
LTQYFQKKQQALVVGDNQQDDLSNDERRILSLMKQQPVDLSYLAQELNWQVDYLLEVLLALEMKQRVYTPQP